MALFHLSVTQTKRSAGQSAIASAAYRAGERLYSEYYGEYSDYTRKGGVICSDILLPSHAPPEFWCVGFVKPCGMPFEQFAPLWLKANFTNDRIFYKPSMRLAGLLSESENSKQKGTIYGKHYRKQGNLRGIESYSPRAGRVIS